MKLGRSVLRGIKEGVSRGDWGIHMTKIHHIHVENSQWIHFKKSKIKRKEPHHTQTKQTNPPTNYMTQML